MRFGERQTRSEKAKMVEKRLGATTGASKGKAPATFIFLEPPHTVFTTDRLDALRKRGNGLAEHLAQVINAWDPGHFGD